MIRQNIGLSLLYCDRVFIVCTGFMISCEDRPPVAILINIFRSHVNHWLNSYHQSFHHQEAFSPSAIIRHFRFFMKRFANSVSYQIPDHTVFVLSFTIVLNRERYIPDPVARNCFFDTQIKGSVSSSKQIENILGYSGESERVRRVPIITFAFDPAINRNNICINKLS